MKTLATLAVAATIGVAAAVAPVEKAEATDWGAAIAGFAVGALVAPHIYGHVYYGPPPPVRVYRYHQPRQYYGGNAHVQWCSWRYRTYNPYTNLYYYKPGRQRYCFSPYS